MEASVLLWTLAIIGFVHHSQFLAKVGLQVVKHLRAEVAALFQVKDEWLLEMTAWLDLLKSGFSIATPHSGEAPNKRGGRIDLLATRATLLLSGKAHTAEELNASAAAAALGQARALKITDDESFEARQQALAQAQAQGDGDAPIAVVGK